MGRYQMFLKIIIFSVLGVSFEFSLKFHESHHVYFLSPCEHFKTKLFKALPMFRHHVKYDTGSK